MTTVWVVRFEDEYGMHSTIIRGYFEKEDAEDYIEWARKKGDKGNFFLSPVCIY